METSLADFLMFSGAIEKFSFQEDDWPVGTR